MMNYKNIYLENFSYTYTAAISINICRTDLYLDNK